MKNILVCIPSDPLEAYEKNGYLTKLLKDNYFNPQNVFSKCIILSPYEPSGYRSVDNLITIGATGINFLEILAKLRPNLVRGYGAFWACDLAIYSGSLVIPDIPVYISVHDSRSELVHSSIIYADRVHCTSSIVKDLCIKKGIDKRKIKIIPNYINHNNFYPSKNDPPTLPNEWNISDDILPILHVGRKDESKNIETVIGMLKCLPKKIYCNIYRKWKC